VIEVKVKPGRCREVHRRQQVRGGFPHVVGGFSSLLSSEADVSGDVAHHRVPADLVFVLPVLVAVTVSPTSCAADRGIQEVDADAGPPGERRRLHWR
jgi:hypothetical protein